MERLEKNKESLQLPESLQNEIQRKDEDKEGQFNDGKPKMARRRPGLPRKEQRKKEREAQKRQRIELHERKVTMKKEAQLKRDDTSNSNANKKRKRDDSSAREAPAANRQSPRAKKQKSNGGDEQAQPSSKKKTPQREPKAKVKEAATQKKKEVTKKKKKKEVEVLPFTMKRDQEDEDLAYLEAKLGLTKSGAKKRLVSELADDGLGELLEGLSDMDSDDFSEDDMAMYRDKDMDASGDDDDVDDEDEDEEDENEDGIEDDEDDDIEEDGDEGDDNVDEDGQGEEEEEEAEELDEEIDELQAKLEALKQKKAQQAEEKKKLEKQVAQQDGKKQKEKVKENGQNADITTAKTDVQPATAAGKYVPPSMRQSSEEERLNRQVRGLLNRLTQSNLHSVGTQLLTIYDDNSDILVNEALCATLLSDLEGMRKGSSAFVLTYAGLVLFLHAQLGTQIGGFVVERVAKAFEESHEDSNSEACSNHVLMLCHLCGFGVVSVGLIFDLMKRLLDSFTPLDIELLLAILTHCGSQLRHDDPAALKEVIMKVQTNALQLKTADAGDADKDASSGSAKTTTATAAQNKSLEGLPPRVRFMLETIYDLKNNKTKQASDANTAQVSQMKTMVKKLLKGKNEGQELRTTWNALLTGKGRWWLVGSAFAEVHFDKRPMKGGSSSAGDGDGDEVDEALEGYDSEIVKLASQQRMTTPVKKAVFCILMSSEDYLDAFEKLLRLNLKNKQDREIIHVLMHCCAQERVFNPFYAHLAAKLCSFDYNYKFTLQYAFWDKFKQLPSLPVRTISNLGILLAHLIANFSLSLSVLKAVEFSEQMEAHTTLFLTLVVKTLLTQFGEEVTTKLFERITGTKELFTFREQLLLFLQTLYAREKKKKDASPESRQEWPLLAERLKAAKQLLKRSTDILFE